MNNKLRSFLLWINLPLCTVLAATGLQIFWPAIYARESANSAAGCYATDILDLYLIVPILIVTTVLAMRGSVPALMIWAGTLMSLAYNFMIYTFEIHFNAMFLAYCAVLGLCIYGLIGVRQFLATDEVAKTYSVRVPRRLMAATFIFIALSAAVNELKEDVSSIMSGTIPAGINEAGQRTDPIHVLDLSFLLPAMVIAGVLLLRRKPLGFVFAPVLTTAMIMISVEVITIVAVLIRRGLTSSWGPALNFGVAGAILTLLLVWWLYPKRKVTAQTALRLA